MPVASQGLCCLGLQLSSSCPLRLPSLLPFSPDVLVLRSEWLRGYLIGANVVAHGILDVVAIPV